MSKESKKWGSAILHTKHDVTQKKQLFILKKINNDISKHFNKWQHDFHVQSSIYICDTPCNSFKWHIDLQCKIVKDLQSKTVKQKL